MTHVKGIGNQLSQENQSIQQNKYLAACFCLINYNCCIGLFWHAGKKVSPFNNVDAHIQSQLRARISLESERKVK